MRGLRRTLRVIGAGIALGACAAEHGPSKEPLDPTPAVPQEEQLTLAFAPMYSAYDGVHTFTLPVRVEGASGPLTVSTEPADFVAWEQSVDGVTLRMRQAGSARVVVEDSQGRRGSTTLFVTEAT